VNNEVLFVVYQQSSEVDNGADNETNGDVKAECLETTKSSGFESTLPVTSGGDAVISTTCKHSEQQLVCGAFDPTVENIAVSGEMSLPVEALVSRGKKLTNEDQTVRYPSITGTLSERCVRSVQHIVQVLSH